MRYERIEKAEFLERPNRFIAYVMLRGKKETVHVKNTGRCAELLLPGAAVYIQRSANPERKTKWDLIAVEKSRAGGDDPKTEKSRAGGNDPKTEKSRAAEESGQILINMDSQIPNHVVKEWLERDGGGLFSDITLIKPETVYRNSRFDLYVETGGGRRIFIEVKGVTLEENGVCRFPDAPSERAVKHLEELICAKKDGYEAYVFFVIQMKGAAYFTPNMDTHPAFGETLKKAKAAGVDILAYDCNVTPESIEIDQPVKVVLEDHEEYARMKETVQPLIEWFRENKRELPWRERMDAYRVWISEIMLQQTRVEAVKPYYERFLSEVPDIAALARVSDDRLMKLWEGLGYYNRARNLKSAAQQVMEEYGGEFPKTYEEIRSLKGIGNYTAGAISSFVYNIPKPAVDGNVLRVAARILEDSGDIMKAGTRSRIERIIEEVIPDGSAGDFNQSLIELGAVVCLPNGEPRCGACPVREVCLAYRDGTWQDYPVKKKAKERRIEKRTVLLFCDHEKTAIRKRPDKGLLAGLYEFPNVEGHLKQREVTGYAKSLGLAPIRVKKLRDAKHVFSHVEWHMKGYEILVDELERKEEGDMIFACRRELEEKYPMPSAFEVYVEYTRFS